MAPSEHADDYEETDADREFMDRHADAKFFLEALESDVQGCEVLCAATPNDSFARRTLVRTVWAEIEGLCAAAIDWARYYADDTTTGPETWPRSRAPVHPHARPVRRSGATSLRPSPYALTPLRPYART